MGGSLTQKILAPSWPPLVYLALLEAWTRRCGWVSKTRHHTLRKRLSLNWRSRLTGEDSMRPSHLSKTVMIVRGRTQTARKVKKVRWVITRTKGCLRAGRAAGPCKEEGSWKAEPSGRQAEEPWPSATPSGAVGSTALPLMWSLDISVTSEQRQHTHYVDFIYFL